MGEQEEAEEEGMTESVETARTWKSVWNVHVATVAPVGKLVAGSDFDAQIQLWATLNQRSDF